MRLPPPSVRPPPAVASPPSVRPPPPSGDPAALAAELEQTKRVLATKLADLRGFQTERETLLARVAERDARIQRLEACGSAEVPRLRTQLTDLESELGVAKAEAARVTHLDAELSALRAQVRRLEGSLSERSTQVAALESTLGERESEFGTRGERVAELEALLAEARARLTEREARVKALENELAESLAWAPATGDDLTRIKGVGPKFRDGLHALGVKSFAQVAGWTDADTLEIAAKLRIQPARIQREGWVEAAQRLLDQGQRVG